jgi:hypothetical protein
MDVAKTPAGESDPPAQRNLLPALEGCHGIPGALKFAVRLGERRQILSVCHVHIHRIVADGIVGNAFGIRRNL